MDSWLLGCVVLCLLGAGPAQTEVVQTPRYLIAKTGKIITVTCSQNTNLDSMYWYRQDPGLGLRLIYYSANVGLIDRGEIADGYNVSRKEKNNFPLIMDKASTGQTSVYLCAASVSTAPHRQLLSAQKDRHRMRSSSLRRPQANQKENHPMHLWP